MSIELRLTRLVGTLANFPRSMDKFTPTSNDCVFSTLWQPKAGDKNRIEFICNRRHVYCRLQPAQQKDLLPFSATGLTFSTDTSLASQWYICIPEIQNTINQNLDIWLKKTLSTTADTISRSVYNALFRHTEDLERKLKDASLKLSANVVADTEVNNRLGEDLAKARKKIQYLETREASYVETCKFLYEEIEKKAALLEKTEQAFDQQQLTNAYALLEEERQKTIERGPTISELSEELSDKHLRAIACICSTTHLKKGISSGTLTTVYKILRALNAIEPVLNATNGAWKIYRKIISKILDLTTSLTREYHLENADTILLALGQLRDYRKGIDFLCPAHAQLPLQEWPAPPQEHLVAWVLPQYQVCSDLSTSPQPTQPNESDKKSKTNGNPEKTTPNEPLLATKPDSSELS